MLIVPIRSDNAYVGISKQTSQGVPVAPTSFVRWLDGTKFEFDLKTEQVWEGDGTRRLSQIIKNMQAVKSTIVFNPRPIELGLFETACMGTGADAYVAPLANTQLSADTTVGASSITVASNVGLTGAGTIALMLTAGGANEEIATFNLPASGTGPYTLTVANSGSLKKSHNTSDGVLSVATHTITDQSDGNYYTIEFGLGSLNGAAGPTIRITDCKIEGIKRSSKAGMLLEYTVDFNGIATVSQNSPSTVTLEAHQPFLFTQGTWTLNGSTTGDALAVESFDIQQKNNLDLAIQTGQLTLAAIIFGNLDVSVTTEIVMQNSQLIALTYWGSTTGTTDAQAIGAGSLTVKFAQADGFHSVQYSVPTMHYDKVTEPTPKKDGKHYKVGIQSQGVSNQGQNTYILQTTVTNAQTVAY